jgi:hypothetical protein
MAITLSKFMALAVNNLPRFRDFLAASEHDQVEVLPGFKSNVQKSHHPRRARIHPPPDTGATLNDQADSTGPERQASHCSDLFAAAGARQHRRGDG